MTLKVKKGSGDINITIENNIFSKNQDKNKPKPRKGNGKGRMNSGTSGVLEAVRNPYEPEPSFLSEIKTAMNERNFYGMKFNPRNAIMPPQYNNWYDSHSRSLQIEDMDDGNNNYRYSNNRRQLVEIEDDDSEDEEVFVEAPEAPNAPEAIEAPPAPPVAPPVPSGVLFDKDGKYLGKRETKEEKRLYNYHRQQRNNYTNGRVEPRKGNVVKYGLQEYFG